MIVSVTSLQRTHHVCDQLTVFSVFFQSSPSFRVWQAKAAGSIHNTRAICNDTETKPSLALFRGLLIVLEILFAILTSTNQTVSEDLKITPCFSSFAFGAFQNYSLYILCMF